MQTIPECAKVFRQLILLKLNAIKRIRTRDPFIEIDAIKCKYLKYVELHAVWNATIQRLHWS